MEHMNLENGYKIIIFEAHEDEQNQVVVPDLDDPVERKIYSILILPQNQPFQQLPLVEESMDLSQFADSVWEDEDAELYSDVMNAEDDQVVPNIPEKEE